MKYIRKRGAPQDYLQWCRDVKGTDGETFLNLKNPEKTSVLDSLMREQGWICAYTMRRIDKGTCHIEHVKPESLCRKELKGSDLDYHNFLACFPLEGMAPKYRYGAQKKGDWWIDNGKDFISPLVPNCEKRFNFDLDGVIHPTGKNGPAEKTIKILGLDHCTLTEERKRVISEYIYGGDGRDAASISQATRMLKQISSLDNEQYYEYCVAIRDALIQYISKLQTKRKRNIYRRRSAKR
jgi:uncharacterized protein (TIGR02646 family)